MSTDAPATTDELKQMALRVAALVDALESRSNAAMDSLSASRQALAQGIAQFDQRGQDLVQGVTRGIDASRQRHHSTLWIGAIALGVGTLMLVVATGVWVAMKREQLAQLDFAEQIHRATEAGTLAPCGEHLCVRVGSSPRRAGEHGEYLVVE